MYILAGRQREDINFQDLPFWKQVSEARNYIEGYEGSKIFEDFAHDHGLDSGWTAELMGDMESHKDIYIPKEMQVDSMYANNALYE